MSNHQNYQQLLSTLNKLENLSLNQDTMSLRYGYQVSLITLLSKQLSTELSSLQTIRSTDHCLTSSQTKILRTALLQLESQIGKMVPINWKNRRELMENGHHWEITDEDGNLISCPVENFEQLELDTWPGMP